MNAQDQAGSEVSEDKSEKSVEGQRDGNRPVPTIPISGELSSDSRAEIEVEEPFVEPSKPAATLPSPAKPDPSQPLRNASPTSGTWVYKADEAEKGAPAALPTHWSPHQDILYFGKTDDPGQTANIQR